MFIYSYSRISDLETSLDIDQLNGILEPELLSVKTYCLNQNWVINEAVEDTNCNWSLKFSQRENGKNLMRRLKQGDILLSSKLERIVSSSQEAVELIINLRNKQIQLHIMELGGDITSKEFSANFEKIARLFSSLEKRKAAERIKGVKQRQRKKGRYLGGSRPFGYMIHENGRLIENPMEQKVLYKIIELKKQGKSLRVISQEVSTPIMPISFKTVQRLLQRHANQVQESISPEGPVINLDL
jgi:DNA invertase Pin-like site-specific DNA recombinase|tara:strand:- start:274 stop:999 length:726 start_codon:yes stop_codon:yes gene_type:complete